MIRQEKIIYLKTIIIKENYDRVNFIDKNDIYIGFDLSRQCCEDFGYYISRNKFDEENSIPLYKLKGYYFDTNKSLDDIIKIKGDVACIKLINDKNNECIYLHLYNNHNGYYCHDLLVGDKNNSFTYYI